MPTLLRWRGHRVFFWSREPNEPPHVHVDHAEKTIKIWLSDLSIACNDGYAPHEVNRVLRMIRQHKQAFWRHGMTTLVGSGERVADVSFSDTEITVTLRDGRRISVPLWWYPRLLEATPDQRRNWEPAAAGRGIHWPEIDEDLDVEGFLRGAKAPGAEPPA